MNAFRREGRYRGRYVGHYVKKDDGVGGVMDRSSRGVLQFPPALDAAASCYNPRLATANTVWASQDADQ